MRLTHLLCKFSILLVLTHLLSCNGKNEAIKTQQEGLKSKLKSEVMEVHNDAMAKMGQLYDLEIAIKQSVDSTNSLEVKTAQQRVLLLKKANREMMDWMQQYQDSSFRDEGEMRDYFTQQMALILKVKILTDSSIVLANQFLKKNN